MREVTTHLVPGSQDSTRIVVLDEPGQGGACHKYVVTDAEMVEVIDHVGMRFVRFSEPPSTSKGTLCAKEYVNFQNGPIKEFGVNGVQLEHHLAIGVDRLECFQAGPYPSKDNAEALEHLRAALAALQRRTRDRVARQVEGINAK